MSRIEDTDYLEKADKKALDDDKEKQKETILRKV